MDDGLVPISILDKAKVVSLNPCCSGRWSRTTELGDDVAFMASLNPCCSGRWSRTCVVMQIKNRLPNVLILVVVDDGLVLDLIRLF